MDVRRRPVPRRPAGVAGHRVRARNVLPPIRLGPSESPMYVTDMVISAILLAVVLTVIRSGYVRLTGDETVPF